MVLLLKLQQANWYLSKESYDNPTIMSSYKTLMKTLVTNLAVTPDMITDQDIDNVLALEKELVTVEFYSFNLFFLLK